MAAKGGLRKLARKGMKVSTMKMVKEVGRHYLADRHSVGTSERTVVRKRGARKKKP